MANGRKALTPIYKERRTILTGVHAWRLAAWARAYYVELSESFTDGPLVLLYAGVDCADDGADLDWFTPHDEARDVRPTVLRVVSRDAALRFAVEDAAAFLTWAWHRIEYMPATHVPPAPELAPPPRDGVSPEAVARIRSHLLEARSRGLP